MVGVAIAETVTIVTMTATTHITMTMKTLMPSVIHALCADPMWATSSPPSDTSKRGNFGYLQQKTREEKQRLRLQQRIQRRHKASERDYATQEEEQKRQEELEGEDRKEFYQKKDQERGLAGPGALSRDKLSAAPSVRDHARSRRIRSTRYRDDADVKQEEGFLSRRAGPGDKSLESLEREPAADTILARFGMLLVPTEEDKTVPAVALAYDAYEEQKDKHAQHAGASSDEDANLGASIRRPNHLDTPGVGGGRPGSREARGMRPGSQSRRGRNNIPESGPGASSLRGTAAVRDFPPWPVRPEAPCVRRTMGHKLCTKSLPKIPYVDSIKTYAISVG